MAAYVALTVFLVQKGSAESNKPEGQDDDEEQTVRTEGIFVKCPECESALYKRELTESHEVCTHCSYHFRYTAEGRLKDLFDDGRYEKLDEDVMSGDPLKFVDSKPYKDRIEQAKEVSGLPEALISGKGLAGGPNRQRSDRF